MTYLAQYLHFTGSFESVLGDDIRMQMEAYSYVDYLRKITKQMNYDEYKSYDDGVEFWITHSQTQTLNINN